MATRFRVNRRIPASNPARWATARESSQDDAKSLEGKQRNKQKGNTGMCLQLWGHKETAALLCFPPCLASPIQTLSHLATRALLSTALLFNALFITFLHLNKADSIENRLNGRNFPKYFCKASLFRERFGWTRRQRVPSAAELCYLRFVAMFGSTSRYCKMPVDSLAAAHPARLSQCPGGMNLLYDPLQAWDNLLCRPQWCNPTGVTPC